MGKNYNHHVLGKNSVIISVCANNIVVIRNEKHTRVRGESAEAQKGTYITLRESDTVIQCENAEDAKKIANALAGI